MARLAAATAVLMGFLAVLAPAADAGTADDPEIQDPAGDATLQPEGQALLLGDSVDFDAVWVAAEDPLQVTFAMRVAELDLATALLADPLWYQSMAVDFDVSSVQPLCEEQSFSARATLQGGLPAGTPLPVQIPPIVRFSLGIADEGCGFDWDTGSGKLDLASDIATITVDRRALGSPMTGDRITFRSADAWNRYTHQTVAGAAADVWDAEVDDAARDYVFVLDSVLPLAGQSEGEDEGEDGPANAPPQEAPGVGMIAAMVALALAGAVVRRRGDQ